METRTQIGSLALIAAVGMTFTSIGADLGGMQSWAQATAPPFVGSAMVHIGAAVAAYIAGQNLKSSNLLLPPSARKPKVRW